MNMIRMVDVKLTEIDIQGELVDTVDARMLHGILGSKQEFASWVKNKITCNAFFSQGVDFIIFDNIVKNPNGGRPRIDYALTLDTAKKVSMAEQTEAGNIARDYFLNCERELKNKPSLVPSLPQNFAEALRLAADLEEEKAALEAKVIEDAPHVEFSKAIEDSSGSIEIGEFAKVLKNAGVKIGRNRLYDFLRDKGYLMRNNVPYQRYIENGYFAVEEKTYESKNGPKPYVLTKITGKGQKAVSLEVTAE